MPIVGQTLTIDFAVDGSGRRPAEDFLNSEEAPLKDRATILRICELLAAEGRICNREKFKKIAGEIWELKSFQVRVAAFQCGRTWFLTHGFVKKSDKWLPAQVRRAERIRAEHLARFPRNKG